MIDAGYIGLLACAGKPAGTKGDKVAKRAAGLPRGTRPGNRSLVVGVAAGHQRMAKHGQQQVIDQRGPKPEMH